MVITKSVAAENQFSDPIPSGGHINLSISGTWTATVWVQRSFDGGANWLDVESFTTNTESFINDPETNVLYRAGVKTGGFTAGPVVIRLSTSVR
jgi:hypothetical protein